MCQDLLRSRARRARNDTRPRSHMRSERARVAHEQTLAGQDELAWPRAAGRPPSAPGRARSCSPGRPGPSRPSRSASRRRPCPGRRRTARRGRRRPGRRSARYQPAGAAVDGHVLEGADLRLRVSTASAGRRTVARQDFSTANARRAVVVSGNSATSSPAGRRCSVRPGRPVRRGRRPTVGADRRQREALAGAERAPCGSLVRGGAVLPAELVVEAGHLGRAASSRPPGVRGGAHVRAWPASDGSGAALGGGLGGRASAWPALGGASVAGAADGRRRRRGARSWRSSVAAAGEGERRERRPGSRAATVGRARARVEITGFLTVTGVAAPA